LSHQRTKQIEEPNVLSALENCAIKMANVDAEARYFSQLLHIPEERINQLPTGTFAMHVRGEGSSIVQVPLAKLPYPQMTETARLNHQEFMEWLYGIETQKPPEGGGAVGPQIHSIERRTPGRNAHESIITHKPPQSEGKSVTAGVPPTISKDPSRGSKWTPPN